MKKRASMPRLPYYERVLQLHEAGIFFAHWNWAAFFFGPIWFAYRRCYFYAFLFFFVTFKFGIIVCILLKIFMGFFGTSLYLRKWVKGRRTHPRHTSLLSCILFSLFTSVVLARSSFSSRFTVPFKNWESQLHNEFKKPPTPWTLELPPKPQENPAPSLPSNETIREA